MFIAILLLALVTLGCVSAADEIQADDIGAIDDVQSEDVSISEDSASEDVLTDGESGSGSLSDLKNDIENAGTTQYDLSRDYSYDANVDTSYYMVTNYADIDNFVLDGKGYTINGGKKTWIFTFENGKNITLKNINFVNCLCAIDVEGENPINIINCNFTECAGSAIIDKGSSIIESCNFIGNTDGRYGAAIHSTSNTTIANCYFQSNTVTGTNSRIYGGAISLWGDNLGTSPLVVNCTFRNNSVQSEKEYTGGGAIYVSDDAFGAKIVNCEFYDNSAYWGGAIYVKMNAHIEGCRFFTNKGDSGAAVYAESASILQSFFQGNIAEYKGGAVYSLDYLNVNNSQFFSNNASEEGGAIDIYSGTIANSYFDSNYAKNGGGVSATYVLTLDHVAFYLNSDDSGNANICISPGFTNLKINNVYTGYNIIAPYMAYSINSGGKYAVTVQDRDGNALVGENVTFIVGNKVIGSGLSDENGLVSIDLTANILKGIKAGTHDLQVLLTNLYQDNIVKLTINKDPATITAKAASFVINYAGKYSVTIRNSAGKVLSSQKVTFTLNGKYLGYATTNANGVATFTLSSNALKTAKYGTKNLVIKLDSPLYTSASKTVKVTIKKEKTSIVAAKKAFRKALKVKKYTITLKNSKGKIIKNAKLTLKVKGKTFKATTNSKGKATFKITNLKTRGKFKASINFKTTAYYLKASKSVYLTIK